MALTIVTNVASLGAQRNLARTQTDLQSNIRRLSSGLRITQAADDAAGLGISEKLRAQIRGLAQAGRNAQDGISATQTAEGALNEMHGILTRMRELAVQAANGTLGDTERDFIQLEFAQLRLELQRVVNVTEFNGTKVLKSAGSGAVLTMQVGIFSSVNDRIAISVTSLSSVSNDLKISGFAAVSTAALARDNLDVLDTAIETLSQTRAKIGAAQNRLTVTIANLSVAHENLSAANSRIRDADVAEETASFTRNQILTQAGVAVLAQANQLPSAALSLIAG